MYINMMDRFLGEVYVVITKISTSTNIIIDISTSVANLPACHFQVFQAKTLGKNYIKASDDRSGTAYPLPVVTGALKDVLQGVPWLLSQLSEAVISLYVDGIKYNLNHLIPTLEDFV